MNCSKIPLALSPVASRLLGRWSRRGAALIVLVATPFCPAARALDFRLDTTSIMFDGFPTRQSFFHSDEANAVYISLPGGTWTASGVPDSLTLTSSKLTAAQIRLEKSNSSASDADFKVKTALDDYRRRAVAGAPSGATSVTVVAEHDLPVDFYHWRDYEFILDYAFFGQSYRRGTLFLDLNPKEQIVVTYTALPTDFDAVRSTALGVLRSWQVKPLNP